MIKQVFRVPSVPPRRPKPRRPARKEPRKLILRNFQAPGDIVMLTAAVRDLHLCYPGEFLTDVRTTCPDLWENNPYLTPLPEDDPAVRVVDCSYPLIQQSNFVPYHFIHGFIEDLNRQLGLHVRPTEFKGDIHISARERDYFARVEARVEDNPPFWLVTAGGKFDFTAKWWAQDALSDRSWTTSRAASSSSRSETGATTTRRSGAS